MILVSSSSVSSLDLFYVDHSAFVSIIMTSSSSSLGMGVYLKKEDGGQCAKTIAQFIFPSSCGLDSLRSFTIEQTD